MTCTRPRPGWYCTRAAGHEGPCAAHPDIPDDKTPVAPHARPAPVVCPSGTLRRPPPLPPTRTGTPHGGTLSPLGRAPAIPPKLETEDERTRMAIMARVLRTCDALPLEDLRLVSALALRLRPGAEG